MSSENETPQGFSKWLGRGIAVILIGFAAFILIWSLGNESPNQSAGSASPRTEQAPAQQPAQKKGDKNFNL